MSKRRILVNNEASFISSGFGNIGKYLIPRLINTGKYEIAEFASYGTVLDKYKHNIKHKYYAAAVLNDDPRYSIFKSNPVNDFGQWRFERVLLDFKPDIVLGFRDYWMDSYIRHSPYRRFFNWTWMTTYDSSPNEEEWIDTYRTVDNLVTYTDWAGEEISKQSKSLNLRGTIPPGVDIEVFKPVQDKYQHRKEMGFFEDSIIFGTVMRNQKRKLYPDLLTAFAKYLAMAPPSLAKKSYLYIHTSYPDQGWNIPGLLKNSDISHKVLFSYICKECKECFASFFQDARGVCPHCQTASAVLPGVSLGIEHHKLNGIYNIMDCYIQYSICLPEYEQIKTINGYRPIKDITLGELVLTHKNRYRAVTKLFINDNQNNMQQLSFYGHYNKLCITDNHPIYAINRKTLNINPKSKRPISIRERIKRTNERTADFINAGTLVKGDVVIKPIDIDYPSTTNYTIDLAEFAEKNDVVLDDKIFTNGGKLCNRFIKVTPGFCKFLGLFAAEGYTSNKRNYIKLTFFDQEMHLLNICKDAMEEMIGNNRRCGVRKYKYRKAIEIGLCSSILARAFSKWCGKKLTKSLPDFIMNNVCLEDQRQLLHGLILGDGCFHKNKTYYSTISPKLAYQTEVLINRQKLKYCCRHQKGAVDEYSWNRQDKYCFDIKGNFKRFSEEDIKYNQNSKKSYIFYDDNNLYLTIKENKSVEYNERNVYNIEVEEDNSYVTQTCAVHNCEGIGMPAMEAGSCGIPQMVVDATGMKEYIKYIDTVPLKISHTFKEFESHSDRVYPDNDYTANKMLEFALLPEVIRKQMGENTRKKTVEHFCWDAITKKWCDVFDAIELTGEQGKWDAPAKYFRPSKTMPENLTNEQFTEFVLTKVGDYPELLNTLTHMNLTRDLNYGATINGRMTSPISRKEIYDRFLDLVNNKNMYEQARVGDVPLTYEDYIIEANK